MLGYTDREFHQLRFTDITHPDDREISEQWLEKVMRREISTYRLEKRYIKKDGSTMWGDLSVSAIRNGNGEHIATLGVIADITDRKEAEEKLMEEKAISDTTIDSLPGTFYVFDDKLKLVRWNKNLEKLTGYSEDEISTMSPLDFFAGEAKAQIHTAIEKVLTDGAFALEADTVTKDGTEIPYWFTSKLVRLDEKQCVIGLGIDLTELKLAEAALKASLKEKEILFREIHHRVKNNLRIMLSLVHLQSFHLENKSTEGVLEDLESRILAIATVHEKLYQSGSLMKIDVYEYLQELAHKLFYTYKPSTGGIELIIDIKDISCSIDTAVPLGLMVSELVANSLKHAFPDGRTGSIVISLKLILGDEFELTVGDTGVGMQGDLSEMGSEKLGLSLVKTMADQLHAEIRLDRTKGTNYRFRFRQVEKLSVCRSRKWEF